MAIGERIHFFRIMRGMTQKFLGTALGFPEKSADVRLAQYENGARSPKADITAALAQILDVSPQALSVPDIDSYTGLMHTLFTLEDRYGLTIEKDIDGQPLLRVNARAGQDARQLLQMLCSWADIAEKLQSGEITKDEYDAWRYHYPDHDTGEQWKRTSPSQGLSDLLVEQLKKEDKK